MSSYAIAVDELPDGGRTLVIDYRVRGEADYRRLGQTPEVESEWEIDELRPFYLRCRIRDDMGRIHTVGAMERLVNPRWDNDMDD